MGQDLVIVPEHDGVQLELFPHAFAGDVFVDEGDDAQGSSEHLDNESSNRNLLLDPNRGPSLVASSGEGHRAARVHDRDQAHRAIQCPQNVLGEAFQAALILGKVRLMRRELTDEFSSGHAQPPFSLGDLTTRDKDKICAVAHLDRRVLGCLPARRFNAHSSGVSGSARRTQAGGVPFEA